LSRALLGFGRSSVQRLPNSKSFLNLIQQCFGFYVCFFLVLECHNSIHPFQTKIAKGMVQGRGHCVHIGISRVMNWRGVEHDERIIQASFPWDSCYKISAANAFMKCLYRAGLWLSHGERDFLLKAGSRCVNLFSKCALRAYNANCTRWKFMPKFHLFG
jgi:hypothetical protein